MSSSGYIDGVLYDDNKSILKGASGKTTLTILASCKIIAGTTKDSYAFKDSANTLESFSFEENPLLETIQSYSFYYCQKLKSIDLSSCSHLTLIGDYAFYGCIKVESILLPKNLTTLNQYSLSYITALRDITLPASLEFFGDACLEWTKIETITFEDNIKIPTIPWRSLGRTSLTTLRVPASVIYFDGSALEDTLLESVTLEDGSNSYCILNDLLLSNDKTILTLAPPLLTQVHIPPSVTRINGSAFRSSVITSIELHSSLQVIDLFGFRESKIIEINIPKSVIMIGTSAFSRCASLSRITFDEGIQLKSLAESTFYSCTSLESISIPDSVTSIGSQCFSGCINLDQVKLPENLTSLGGAVFQNCSDTINITFGSNSKYRYDGEQFLIISVDNTSISQYLSDSITEVTIPADVEEILPSAFSQKTQITTVTFLSNEKLITIGKEAFKECKNLSTINIPQSVTTIGQSCFSYCNKLEEISLPSLINLSDSCFYSCARLRKIEFENLEVIGEYALALCKSLSEIVFGDQLTQINEYAFQSTSSLLQLEFPESLRTILGHAFDDSGITTITFKDGSQLVFLNELAFSNATHLSNIELPPTLNNISSQCFSYTSLTNFTVPIGTFNIDSQCFSNCQSLVSFTIPQGCALCSIGADVFRNCINLKSVISHNDYFTNENDALLTISREYLVIFPPASPTQVYSLPQDVKFIQDGAFYGCKNLVTILIPENGDLKTIGRSAFENCIKLKTINIPASLENIYENAFSGCNNILCDQIIKITDKNLLDTLENTANFPRKGFQPCVITMPAHCETTNKLTLIYLMMLYHRH